MQIKATAGEHELVITEVVNHKYEVYGIDFFCHTCDDGNSFDHHTHPKYRLAMQAARDAAKAHTGSDMIVWHLN